MAIETEQNLKEKSDYLIVSDFHLVDIEDNNDDWKKYKSPDSLLYAKIIPAKKNLLGNAYENRVEIRTKENKLLQNADYTSEDRDHGLIISQSEWTPDSRFFIYSAYSSGGHQPYFSRVYFYSRSDNKIYNFSKVSGFDVAENEFRVEAPDIVVFTVYTSLEMVTTTTKSFKLSEILSILNTWKTYRNKKYGFEVKYPPSAIQNLKVASKKLEVFTSEKCRNQNLYLRGEEFKGCQKISVLAEMIKANFGSSAEAIRIDGLPGEKFYYRIPEDYYMDNVRIYRPIGQINAQVEKWPYWYKINIDYYLSEEAEAEKLFNQVISTFRFIEKDQTKS